MGNKRGHAFSHRSCCSRSCATRATMRRESRPASSKGTGCQCQSRPSSTYLALLPLLPQRPARRRIFPGCGSCCNRGQRQRQQDPAQRGRRRSSGDPCVHARWLGAFQRAQRAGQLTGVHAAHVLLMSLLLNGCLRKLGPHALGPWAHHLGPATLGAAPLRGSAFASQQGLLGQVDLAFLGTYAIGMFFAGHLGDRLDLRLFLTVGEAAGKGPPRTAGGRRL